MKIQILRFAKNHHPFCPFSREHRLNIKWHWNTKPTILTQSDIRIPKMECSQPCHRYFSQLSKQELSDILINMKYLAVLFHSCRNSKVVFSNYWQSNKTLRLVIHWNIIKSNQWWSIFQIISLCDILEIIVDNKHLQGVIEVFCSIISNEISYQKYIRRENLIILIVKPKSQNIMKQNFMIMCWRSSTMHDTLFIFSLSHKISSSAHFQP